MKVKRLIEKLQKMDPEARVYIGETGDWGGYECLYVKTEFDNNGAPDSENIWLQTELDVEPIEINATFNRFIEDNIDELDAYTEMLDIGITPEMVRDYVGDEAADHMEKFMEEHGL